MTDWTQGPAPEIPLHAGYIWYADGDLWLAIGGTKVKLPPHRAVMPFRGQNANKRDMVLQRILMERAAKVERIGTESHPTQAQVPDVAQATIKAWMDEARANKAALKASAEAAKKKEMEDFLAELGL